MLEALWGVPSDSRHDEGHGKMGSRREMRSSQDGGAGTEAVVLLSGGIDSAGVIAHCLARGRPVRALHVDLGQPSRISEWAAARRIAAHYDVPIERVVAEVGLRFTGAEQHARNALLILIAAGRVPREPRVIALGIHAGVPYYDCSAGFVSDVQRLVDGYFGGSVQIDAPFLHATKREVIELCIAHGVPLGLTYSCERRSRRPCGECPSCQDRRNLVPA